MHTYYTKISLVLMAYFPKYRTFFEPPKKPLNFWKFEQKLEETFNISKVFEYFTFGQVNCSTLYTSRKSGAKMGKYG